MREGPPFDAAQWIAKHTPDGVRISEAAKSVVSSFATMWNLFEIALCDNSANPNKLVELTDRLDPDSVRAEVQESIRQCSKFWRDRYISNGRFNDKFEGLHFRESDKRESVEAVLQKTDASLDEELLACLLIVYRLRNNLFHGLKSFAMLNDQVENLDTGCRCLAAVLLALKSEVVTIRLPDETVTLRA